MTSAYSASASFFDRALQWAEIRVPVFRALPRAYVLMDFRSQQFGRATATRPKALITPFLWVVGQYLLLGCVGRRDTGWTFPPAPGLNLPGSNRHGCVSAFEQVGW